MFQKVLQEIIKTLDVKIDDYDNTYIQTREYVNCTNVIQSSAL